MNPGEPLALVALPKQGCKSSLPSSVSFGPPLVLKPTLRQVKHPEGQHYFKKRDGVWACECGAKRDANGRPIKA